MAEINFEGIPVMVTSLEMPPGMRVVTVKAELYGPNNPNEFGVQERDREHYVYFESLTSEPIGFALLDAAKAMVAKRMVLQNPLETLYKFDMPARFISGVKAAMLSIHRSGFKIVSNSETLAILRNMMAPEPKPRKIQ